MNVLVLDAGGGSVRAGFSGAASPTCVVPNCTATLRGAVTRLVADETVAKVKDFSQLQYTRPMERGILVDWDCQRTVFDHVFARPDMNVDPENNSLLMTVAPFTPEVLLEDIEQVVFEEYGFASFRSTTAALLASIDHAAASSSATAGSSCSLVVDSGFSSTHTVPIFDSHVVRKSWWPDLGGGVRGGLALP